MRWIRDEAHRYCRFSIDPRRLHQGPDRRVSLHSPRSPVPRTVVVVEDNPITRKMMVVALQLAGYSAFGAGDGASALALVEQKQPDLVVEDLILPDMDG